MIFDIKHLFLSLYENMYLYMYLPLFLSLSLSLSVSLSLSFILSLSLFLSLIHSVSVIFSLCVCVPLSLSSDPFGGGRRFEQIPIRQDTARQTLLQRSISEDEKGNHSFRLNVLI